MSDPIVLSYHNALIRESDFKLLQTKEWIPDTIIEFWFEYLQNHKYQKNKDKLLCLSPSLVQLIKLTPIEDLPDLMSTMESLNMKSKSLILIPINDSHSLDKIGGSHWSLLALVKNGENYVMEYYDSSSENPGIIHSNQEVANIVNKMSNVLSPLKKIEVKFVPCLIQGNNYNCGIHLICNADSICQIYLERNSSKKLDIREIISLDKIDNFRLELFNIINMLKEEDMRKKN